MNSIDVSDWPDGLCSSGVRRVIWRRVRPGEATGTYVLPSGWHRDAYMLILKKVIAETPGVLTMTLPDGNVEVAFKNVDTQALVGLIDEKVRASIELLYPSPNG